jgi:hypothetical protein
MCDGALLILPNGTVGLFFFYRRSLLVVKETFENVGRSAPDIAQDSRSYGTNKPCQSAGFLSPTFKKKTKKTKQRHWSQAFFRHLFFPFTNLGVPAHKNKLSSTAQNKIKLSGLPSFFFFSSKRLTVGYVPIALF